ncbi:MAG: FAD-binding oxidoreductase [Acidimicrobiaceae bacterium]|nr:FAD-binding oxidoreductase [Acidimicrobiaceae bacterium]MYL05232.1 FAD-binding oxidoreductase [Acidimicrobiaceae bacterium]
MMGSGVAWFLSRNPDFDGTVLVVERDPSYQDSSTARTNSCMRQQFSTEVNIRISQFGAEFVRDFRAWMDDPEAPEIAVNHFGYLYLAADEATAAVLRANQRVQASLGAGTVIMTPDEIAAEYPFYNLDGIVCGSHNPVDEGWFDSGTIFEWWRRQARRNGVEYHTDEVVGIDRRNDAVTGVALASGGRIGCGTLVNATGPRAARTAAMAGLELPVEPRKRFTWIFEAAEPLARDLPLTIDPTGVHVRSDGAAYLAGCPPDIDPPVDPVDLDMDHDIFEDKVWPALAHRIAAFERIKVTSRWAGHYAYNRFDHNAVVGPHPEVSNFLFVNGFSGHGMQQSPAMGRAVSELITYGQYRTLDLSALGYERIARGEPFVETAII